MIPMKLQNLVFPEMKIETESVPEILCYRADCRPQRLDCGIKISAGQTVDFYTYFNALPIRRWKKFTYANQFELHLKISGDFEVEIFALQDKKETEILESKLLSSKSKGLDAEEVVYQIPDTDSLVASFRIVAHNEVVLESGYYAAQIDESCIRDVRISLATTTFRKETFIKRNIAQLKEKILIPQSELKGHLFVHVIDNGRTLEPSEFDCEDLKVYPNLNTGGSGGFARGMMEAIHHPLNPTHVLVMDDDVLILPESLLRTYYLLRIVRSEHEEAFVSGAMLDYDEREKLYEDVGFVNAYHGSYGPVKRNKISKYVVKSLNLSETNQLYVNEIQSFWTRRYSYAGWWYCCIPVSLIRRNGLPLPLFVRGDDVEFSLRNQANFITMNGISIWHVGFTRKFNAAMELYQVHRNSFIIRAASGVCSRARFLWRINKLFFKEITRFAYANAEQLTDSIEDYLKGPEFLVKLNGELSIKQHAAKNDKLLPEEEIRKICDFPNGDPTEHISSGYLTKLIYLLTLNGHLLPDFCLSDEVELISYGWDFCLKKNYLRKRLVAMNEFDRMSIIRTIDRKQCFRVLKRYFKVIWRYFYTNRSVAVAYRKKFDQMTSEEFWREYLSL